MNLHPYTLQVAGSTPLLKTNNGYVAKAVSANEAKFYDNLNKRCPELVRFVPKYSGRVSVTESFIEETKEEVKRSENSTKRPRESKVEELDSRIRRKLNCWSYKSVLRKLEERKTKILRDSNSSSEEGDLVFILLKDVADKIEEPFILDLKVGTQQHSPKESLAKIKSKTAKCKNSTSATLGLRLCGMRTYFDGEVETRDKYFGRKLTDTQFEQTLKRFFAISSAEEVRVHRKAIVSCLLGKLEDLISAIKRTKWRFYGCSVLIAFDGTKNSDGTTRASLKVIDFAKADFSGEHESFDSGFIFGLENLRRILKSIENSASLS